MLNNFSDICYAFYINLKYRIDRRQQIERELSTIGINAKRFNAIPTRNGFIGCSMSHLRLLQDAVKNNYSHLLILEDDIQFLDFEKFKTNFNKFLELHGNDWDVILFAGNDFLPLIPVDETCVRVTGSLTTTGYLVNGHYLRTLRDNIKEGLEKLIKTRDRSSYSIDIYWFHLQKVDKWYLIIPSTVRQRESYSDIEKRFVRY